MKKLTILILLFFFTGFLKAQPQWHWTPKENREQLYCAPVISQPCDAWISNVSIGTINNNTTQPNDCNPGGYSDFTSLFSLTAVPGQVVNFSIIGNGNSFQWASIFIDYNNDEVFDENSEWVASGLMLDDLETAASGFFTIPSSQANGSYRIRVKSYGLNEPYTGPCGDNVNGDIEDYTLIVNCVANGAAIVVKGNNTVIADGDITPDLNDFTDFGNVVVNTVSSRTYTIVNTGTNTLNVSGVTITGDWAVPYFTVTSQPANPILQAGESTTFTIAFTPDLPGTAYDVVMHINSDHCAILDYDIALRGTGTCPVNVPDINVQGNGIDIARFDFSPSFDDHTDFGEISPNTSVSRTFTIQNLGTEPLNISNDGIQLFTFDPELLFELTTAPSLLVLPGESTTFTITFTAGTYGTSNAYVRIETDDCDEPNFDFLIQGNTGCPLVGPEIGVKGNSIDIPDGNTVTSPFDNTYLGVVEINSGLVRTFTIENTGEDPLSIAGVYFTGTNADEFFMVSNPAALVAPGDFTTLSIQLLPVTSGQKFAEIHILNDDCNEADFNFSLEGLAVCAEVPVSFTGLSTTYCISDAAAVLTGTPAGGIFSGPGITGNIFDPTLSGTGVHSITYTFTAENGCTYQAIQSVTVIECAAFATINLKLFLQGYYQNSGSPAPMDNFGAGGCLYVTGNSAQPADADYITISLMNASDGSLVESQDAVLHTDGNLSAAFSGSLLGNSYYIRLQHRNSVETWSMSPVAINAVTSYDFTASASQAFGNNMAEVEPGVWAMYSGDIIDAETASPGIQDGVIESSDYSQMENDVYLVTTGYVASDITGDGVVESMDYSIMENNVYLVISVMRPF